MIPLPYHYLFFNVRLLYMHTLCTTLTFSKSLNILKCSALKIYLHVDWVFENEQQKNQQETRKRENTT